MTESCVRELKIQTPTLKHFIREVQKLGNIFMLNDLYAHDQKQHNEIILGVICHISSVIKNHDRQLLVIYLHEVTVDCQKGKLFNVYAFNKFATSLADARLQKGDFAAFRSAYIEENTKYRVEIDCHDLQARMGIPPRPGAKVFFIRKSRMTNFRNSQRLSPVRCLSPYASLKRLPNTINSGDPASTFDRGPSPSLIVTSCNSRSVSPLSDISDTIKVNSTSPRVSSDYPLPTYSSVGNASPAVSPDFSSVRVMQPHGSLGENAVRLQNTKITYTYKKISELVEPEQKVNVYGVVSSITKMPTESTKHAIVRLRDETCRPTQDFRVHIFFKCEQAFPKLECGYILRLHRMKTELFNGVLDGRVFSTSDIVTFPPEGQGLKNAFSTAGSFHFCDSDARCLTELRRWFASQNQELTASTPVPATVNSTAPLSPQVVDLASDPTTMANVHQSDRPSLMTAEVPDTDQVVVSSEPTATLLSEIKKEGSYNLVCKVLKVEILSDEMLILKVTDGTLCTFSVCFDKNSDTQEEAYASREVRILVLDPPLKLKQVKKGSFVELKNVKVELISVPQFKRPILSFKLIGNDNSVNICKGLESKAVTLRRRLKAVQLKLQHHNKYVELQIRKLAPECHKRQQPGDCACPSSSSLLSLLSSSDSDSPHTNTEYDSEIDCGTESENRSTNVIKEIEKSVSRPVSSVSRKRHMSHEDVRFGSGHKLKKIMSEDLDSQRMVGIGVADTQTNDEAPAQIEVFTNNTDNSELLLNVDQSHSGSMSQSSGIQRQTISKQTSLHSNNLELTNSKSLSVMSKQDTNHAVSCKQFKKFDVQSGAHGIKSVPPPSSKKPNSSENSGHNTSSTSVTSSKDQFMSAVSSPLHSSPILKQCTVNKQGSRIVTSAQQEGNVCLPSTSKQQISLHQTKDMIESAQKLQQSITFPLSLSNTNGTTFSKKLVSMLLNDLGKAVIVRHCTSGKAHDSLEQGSNVQGQRSRAVTPTSAIPDSSSFHCGFQSNDDLVDNSVRSLSGMIVRNDLNTEPSNSVSSPVILDNVSQNSSRIASVPLAHKGKMDNKVAASKDTLSGIISVDNGKNKSEFKLLHVEMSRGDDFVCVAQHPVQENDQSNSKDYAEVRNTPPPLTSVGDRNCWSLQKSVAEQNISNTSQFPLSEKISDFSGNSNCKEQHSEHSVVSEQSMQQDYIAGSMFHKDDAQERVDEINEMYDQFANAIQTRSGAQYYTSTQSSGSQNMTPVFNADSSRGDELSDTESVASEVIPASEVDDLDLSDKFSALKQACVTSSLPSSNQDIEDLLFVDDIGSGVSSSVTKNNGGIAEGGHIFEENKSGSEVKEDCIAQGDRRCRVLSDKHTTEDEHMGLSSAELDNDTIEYKVVFASGINAMPGILKANISYIKKKRITRNQQVYLLKAWVKDVEPPIHSGSKTDIITGFCKSCTQMQSYEALVKRAGTNQPLCGHCFKTGKKNPVVLAFLLRLYLIDENDDELIVTVSAHHGVELLGCPINAYLSDSMAQRRVRQILTKLIEKNKNVPVHSRGPMLKLLIMPVHTSEGTEYLVHNTYLFSC